MGKVLAPRSRKAIISHAFPCRVAELHVEVGHPVEAGDALVTLACHEVGAAMSEFYKARADLELATINLEREKRLLENDIGVKKNLQAVEAAHKVAQLTEEAAEKRLHVLGFTEEQVEEIADTHRISPAITLYSPIAGGTVVAQAIRPADLGPRCDRLARRSRCHCLVVSTRPLEFASETVEVSRFGVDGPRPAVTVDHQSMDLDEFTDDADAWLEALKRLLETWIS